MQRLTEIALRNADRGVFTHPEVACWSGGSAHRQAALLRRALASGEVQRVRRGLYCLAPGILRRNVDPLLVAQRVYGPSYVSLETALSHHGWIPEAVRTITSVSLGRSREFDTPLGCFSFTRVPQAVLYAGVAREEAAEGGGFLLAAPAKALADYVHVHACDWDSSAPLEESLRIEPESVATLDASALRQLSGNYRSRRVRRFLEGLAREVGR